MDAHTLNLLEFTSVKKILADSATAPLGKKIIGGLRPLNSRDAINARLQRITELIACISDDVSLPCFDVDDISDMLDKIAIEGAVLDTEGFLMFWAILRYARHIRQCLDNTDRDIPALKELAQHIVIPMNLEKAISFVFTEDGKIKDKASARLRAIRTELRSVRSAILKRLNTIIEARRDTDCFSNDQITIREGRYVLFVKSSMRQHVKGVIHDKSVTGSTCFIEPADVIERGNKLRALRFDERNEILRIKRFLTKMMRDALPELRALIPPIADYELAHACAKFAIRYDMTCPTLSLNNALIIKDGRHPLLLARIGKSVVPINVSLREDSTAIIITGPNMGGKTVALKTIGLLCLMAQTGLPVPVADGSSFPLFDALFADIGDEQSLEKDTSTFSSHILRIKEILASVKRGSYAMVLIDEFGTGTDPSEGAALAIAILEEMLQKDMFVVANTHLFQLKLFASQKKGVHNASMLYDEQAHAPTYKLVMDIPGASNAMEIARHLGLPSNIIYHARTLLGKTPGEMDSLIHQLHEQKIGIINDRKMIDEERKTVNVLLKRYRDKLARFDKEKQHELKQKLNEMDDTIKTIRRDFEKAVAELQTDKPQKQDTIKAARRKWDTFQRTVHNNEKELVTQPAAEELHTENKEDWNPGDEVVVAPFMVEGVIDSVNRKKKKAIVLSENRHIEVPFKNLSRSQNKPNTAKQEKDAVLTFHTSHNKRSSFAHELDLRGKYVDDVAPLIEKYISDALMLGFKSITIIHGFGTGKVKRAVHTYLTDHPQITEFREGRQGEGGLGVTIAELKA